MNHSIQQDNQQIRRVTYLGIVINLALSLIKGIVGFAAGSIGLIADGIHSLSDLVTDAAILVGIHFGSKKPDASHPFGHGRMETFSAAVVAIILGLVGCGMIYEAAMEIARVHAAEEHMVTISMAVIWVALLSILTKEGLYHVTRIVAVRSHSTALYANAWHHRSDALSSVAVLAGAIAVRFGYPHGDQLAAIGVGLMIILVSVRILGDCINELSERSADQTTVTQIEAVLSRQPQIVQWHKLRTRSVGREVFLDVHILVSPDLKITEAHAVADQLEEALRTQLPRPVNVMIHVEPDLPGMRK